MGRRDKSVDTKDIGTLPLGAKLRLIRQSKKISLTKMAELSNYTKSYLSTVENGNLVVSKDLIREYERLLGFVQGGLTALFETKDAPFSEMLESFDWSKKSETKEENRVRKIPFDEVLLLAPSHFVGREEDVTWLIEKITLSGMDGIAALRGLGGIGKTSLVAMVARKLHDEGFFSDGIAVVFCQDFKEPIGVLQNVLSRFDSQYHESEIKNIADLSEIAYQLLHGKKLLVILDNIQPELAIEQVVAPLRNAGAALLLTSRHILPHSAVPTYAVRKLELLSSHEALDLFAHSFGKESAVQLNRLERDTAERIIKALDRHTLAVKLSGIYAANLDRDLETLAEILENPQKVFELSENEVPHVVKHLFDRSLEALPQETQMLFSALATFATTELSRNAAIALTTGLGIKLAEINTNILILRSLLDAFVNDEMPRRVSDRERLRLHPLLRALAVAQFEKWPEERRYTAYQTVMQYYADYVARLLKEISDPDEIVSAADPDRRNITASLEWAYAQKKETQTMMLCSLMQHVWNNQWDTEASLHYLPWGIAAARSVSKTAELSTERTASLRCLAKLTLSYGYMLQLTSEVGTNKNLEDVQSSYDESLSTAIEIQDQQTVGVTLYRLGRLFRQRGELEKAEGYYQEALPILRELQNLRDEGWALAFLGQIKHDQGNLQEAEYHYKEALAIHRAIKYRRGEGWIIGYLGRLALTYRELDKAKAYYLQYLEIAEQQQDRLSKGICLNFLGEIALANKEYEEAEKYLREAYAIMNVLDDKKSKKWISDLMKELVEKQEKYR
jgi:tetratricopeptide (TPR) repeat protein/transcriptional regulator with XRE-family HTH domain